jgi:zinc protease
MGLGIGSSDRWRMVAWAGLALAVGCRAPEPPKHAKVEVDMTHFEGSSGVRVYITPDHSTSLIQISVQYSVGSSSDPPGKAGMAHLVEHLMFEKLRQGMDKTIKTDQVRLARYFNAHTTEDWTHYEMLVDPENFDDAVALEVERLVTGCDGLDEPTFEREREVVRNEMRQTFETPTGRIRELLLEAAYPDGHPYRHTTIGDDEQLTNITLEDACGFVRQHYQPHRAVFVVSGNVTVERATKITQQWLSLSPAAKHRVPPPKIPPISVEDREVVHGLPVENTTVFVMWKAPPTFSRKGRMLTFVTATLDSVLSGFAIEHEFADSVSVFTLGGAEAPLLVAAMQLTDASKRDEALTFLRKSNKWVERSLSSGSGDPWTDYLWAVRRTYRAEALIASVESITGRAQFFANAAQFEPESGFLIGALKELDDTEPEQLRSLAKSILSSDSVVVVVEPDGTRANVYAASGRVYQPQVHDKNRWKIEVDVSEAERSLDPPPLGTPPKVARYSLDNGLKVRLWPHGELPIVRANLVCHSGSAREPASQAGLADAAASGDVGPDFTVFSARDLSTEVDDTIKRLSMNMRRGIDGMESLRKVWKRAVGKQSYQADLQFHRDFRAALYGTEHPYTTTGLPTPESIENIDVDAANNFLRKHYTARNCSLIVSGQFDTKLVTRYIRDEFGHLTDKRPPAAPDLSAAALDSGPAYVVSVAPSGPVLTFEIGFVGGIGIDRRYAARLVLASMLDAQTRVLREDLGASYGAHASYTPRVGPGMWTIYGTVDATRGAEAITTVEAALDQLRRGEGSFKAEFVLARREVLRHLLVETRNSSSMLSRLTMLDEYGLDQSYYDELVEAVAFVRLSDVRELIQAELSASRQVLGLYGEKQAVRAAVDASRRFHNPPATEPPMTPPTTQPTH